ncbi:MAG: ABC transporter permease [Vicinamibacterales bacterium]
MSGVVDDLRQGLRALRRAPGFSALAIVTLALGIGGTAAMFSVVYGVLLRPLPFAAPERLVRVWTTAPNGHRGSFAPARFLDVEREARTIVGTAAYVNLFSGLAAGGDPVRLAGAEVTAGFFDVLGVSAARGRTFTAADRPGAALLVLSDGAWRQQFGADPAVVGRTLRVDGEPVEVVGVMPPDVALPERARFWRLAPRPVPTPPMEVEGDLLTQRELGYMDVVARLAPGVTPAEAAAELRVLAATLARRHPDQDTGNGFDLEPVYETIVGDVRQSLVLLFAGVGAVLLIATTNVASLMLARALTRRRELSVRTALGAPLSRLARQLIVESLLLALAGGALGLVVAGWALEGLRLALPASVPRAAAIHLDLTAVAFAALVSVVVGLAFGTAPAWTSRTLASVEALKDGGRTGTGGRQWLRRGLVVGQVAMAAVLVAAAGLLAASLVRLQAVDVGFRADGVVTQQLVLPQSRYDRAAQTRFYEAITTRLADDPRVAAAGVVFPSPFVSSQASATMRLDRPAPGDAPDHAYSVRIGSITPGFFAAMGIPLLAGRTFDSGDFPQTSRRAIVNQAFAERLLGGGDVIGRWIAFDDDSRYTIVGLVGDARAARLDAAAEPIAYLPHTHLTLPFMRLVVRGTTTEAATREAMAAALRAEAPDLALDPPATLAALVHGSAAEPRFRSRLVALFAVTALALAVLGVYSLVSFTVSGRTREIATRLALGASPGAIRAGVIHEGLALTAAGLLVGLAVAAAARRLIVGLLFDTGPFDPAVLGGLVLVMAGGAVVACYLPARRAMRIAPTEALRAE